MTTEMATQGWQELMKMATEEMTKWRKENKQARFTEIEGEVDGRLAVVRRQILEDMLLASESADIAGQEKGKRVKCPECGVEMRSEGKRKRMLTTEREQRIELERSYASCPECGMSFFPPG